MSLRRLSLGAGVVAIAMATVGRPAFGQTEYRNLEAGRPIRVSDAIPTERYGLDLDLTTLRLERLSLGRYRLQYEPRVAYGILPRTEISLRFPSFYRERSISPRGGLAGVGIGGEYQLALEHTWVPALGLSVEGFVPTGPNALRTSFSGKGLLTKSFRPGRLHLNASYGTFAVRKASAGGVLAPPVIDGPCDFLVPETGMSIKAFCGLPEYTQSAVAAASRPSTVTKYRWAAGAGIDKSFAISSTLIAADVVAEKYQGIGRPMDWSAELGMRKQFTQLLVLDIAAGRRFTGTSPAWFATAGSTITMPFRP